MIDVALTRAAARPADVAVVVDVLRATSTIAQALAAGYERVTCATTLEHARRLAAPGRTIAGERGCRRPPGFATGNSPREARERHSPELVLTTTNGTPTILLAARRAPCVLTASLLNLKAVCDSLAEVAGGTALDVQIVCAGASGAVALDDVYVAGRLCAGLEGPRTDAALVAQAIAASYETPLRALRASSSARMLSEVGLGADVVDCARESRLEVLPAVTEFDADTVVLRDSGPAGEAELRDALTGGTVRV